MSSPSSASHSQGPTHRSVEVGIAVFLGLLGLITLAGSLKVGIGWGAEGPKAGFFPFWVGLVIVAASALNAAKALASTSTKIFAEWDQLRQVGKVVAPTTVYVFAVPWLGIYVASMLLIAGFMRWLGRYGWPLSVAISICVMVLTYVTFEKWFLVPLPKGPIEDWLGL